MLIVLRWWFIVCLTGAGAWIGLNLGLFEYIRSVDVTYLSFVTLALFTAMSLFVGVLSFQTRTGDKSFEKHLPLCWYTSDLMLGLGMIGTLIGFLLLLQGVFTGNIDLQNTAATQKLLASMGTGFATAGITTLVGLACSLIFRAQLINLEYALDE